MEDAPLTTQVVMPPVTEDDDESGHSRNTSQISSYVILNDDSHVQTPLLETDSSNEATHELENANAHVSPGTVDISDVRDSDDLTPLPNSSEHTDPRGEAPPYFEVVGDLEAVRATTGELTRVETTDTLPLAPDDEQSVEPPIDIPGAVPETRRTSMFRGLINAASRALSSPHTHPQSPTASRLSRDVVASPRPSNLSTRPVGTRSSQLGHRAMPSNSGSVLSVTSSAFGRATTRSRSTSNVAAALTSPSMISISSISAPLRHTAVRTDFVYPRSGPTPEQLKLISSVESVSKFGVPYGPAAVAYASASRVNLQTPPPDFEERPSLDGSPGSNEATTRARPRSALNRGSQEENTADSRPSESSPPPPPAQSTAVPQPTSTPTSEPAVSSPDSDTFDDTKEQEWVDPVETAPPRPPSPSPTVATASTAATVTKAASSALGIVAEPPGDLIPSSSHRPALPSFNPAAPTTRKPVAPSSFRMPSTPLGGVRPGSRASSVDTFRTATSLPEQGQRGDEIATSDTDTDAFTDAESGAETESETPTATLHAVPVVGSIALGPESHAISV